MDEIQKTDIVATPTDTAASTTTTPAATGPLTTGNSTVDAYNANRRQQMQDIYDKALQSTTLAITNAGNKNIANAEYERSKINPMYQERANELLANYERWNRNNGIQAATTGINSGAGSQLRLAGQHSYGTGYQDLLKSENEALREADRGILDLKTDMENGIAEAVANNDYELAKKIFDLYGDEYQSMMENAKLLASYGDFSLYKQIYGEEEGNNMERSWLLENPQLAYTLGKITADDYYKMTGRYPAGYGGGGYGGGGGSRSSGGTPQGYYSSGTVANVQRALGVTADGMAGPQTYAALQNAVSSHPEYQQYINKWYN